MRTNTKFRLALTALTLVALFLGTAALAVGPVRADAGVCGDWVITVNYNDMTIHTVDTASNTVYGPFLGGQLGTPGQDLLDVAVTPDGNTAIVSNFWGQTYFVNVSDPTNPSLLGSLDLSGVPLYAEDIAITQDGQFALVTDGWGSTVVASVNIATRTLVDTKDLTPNKAEAVAVAPNGTVIVAGTDTNTLATLTIDGAGNLTVGSNYTNGLNTPINVGVAPDGQTVIVCNFWDDTVGVYQVTGPGTLTYIGTVSGLPGGQQSVAFNAAGDKAYVVSEDPSPDQLSVLDITAPGNVSLNTAGAANLLGDSTGFYGVDRIAVTDGVAYVSSGEDAVNNLAAVNLTHYSVSSLAVGDFPAGVAAFSIPCAPPEPVGGIVVPVNKLELLSPWLGLVTLAGLAAVGVVLVRKRRA